MNEWSVEERSKKVKEKGEWSETSGQVEEEPDKGVQKDEAEGYPVSGLGGMI